MARGIRAVRDYLALVQQRATTAFHAGVSRQEAARALESELQRAGYAEWCDGERIVATVAGVYRHLQRETAPPNVGAMFAEMAAFRAGQARAEG